MPLFGKTRVELAGVKCSEALAPEMAALWCGRFERAFEGEAVLLRERRGESTWYRVGLSHARRKAAPATREGSPVNSPSGL